MSKEKKKCRTEAPSWHCCAPAEAWQALVALSVSGSVSRSSQEWDAPL